MPRMFVLAVPGLATLVRRELEALRGVRVTALGYDGRADVIVCEVESGRELSLLDLVTAEDVFVEVGRTLRGEGDRPRWIARRLLKRRRLADAVPIWRNRSAGTNSPRKGSSHARRGGPGGMTFRVIVRVLQEHTWRRTELRRALVDAVGVVEPAWRIADPAQVEIWALEYARGRFVAGLRLSDARLRQHQGRAVERRGALRPTVAAAMVRLAGAPPPGGHAVLLDPCCGSGTILREALSYGWSVEGRDIDRAAVTVARRNLHGTSGREWRVLREDARKLDLGDAAVAACVSNLPFGRQYAPTGDRATWLADVLAELARVTQPGGRVVVLVPDIPRSAVPATLRYVERHPVTLLGMRTMIWAYERR